MYVLIDESSFNNNSYIYGALSYSDDSIDSYTLLIRKLREDIVNDPIYFQYLDIDHMAKSFHYTQDHREVKNKFIDLFSEFAFEAFVYIYYDVEDIKNSRTKFISGLNWFLSRRYQKPIKYIWEKDKSIRKIEWPTELSVIEKFKQDDELLAITDYIIGIFRKIYLHEYTDSNRNGYIRDYERIKNKIRFIKDEKIKKPYTRNNPFAF